MRDKDWMQLAYEQALLAQEQGEVPVGAVLVSSDNLLLGVGYNMTVQTHDPSNHAEVVAIRQAAHTLHNHRLLETTLYVTLEPCAMCAGLLVQSRIKRLVFATRDFKAGAAGSVVNLLHGYPYNHSVLIDDGVLQEKCALLLSEFFRQRR